MTTKTRLIILALAASAWPILCQGQTAAETGMSAGVPINGPEQTLKELQVPRPLTTAELFPQWSVPLTEKFRLRADSLSRVRPVSAALDLNLARPSWRWEAPLTFDFNQVDVDVAGAVMPVAWEGGGIVASGSRQSLPGLMGIESGSVGFTQGLGPLTVSLGASARKYAVFRGLHTQWSLDAQASWQIDQTFSLHGFATWAPRSGGRWALGRAPAVLGFMDTSRFGGFLRIEPLDHWGVDVGAQSYYDIRSGHNEVAPIVRPYYKFNKDVRLGIDVGGILYELFKGAGGGYAPRNPTFGPPVPMGPPPVAPRR